MKYLEENILNKILQYCFEKRRNKISLLNKQVKIDNWMWINSTDDGTENSILLKRVYFDPGQIAFTVCT